MKLWRKLMLKLFPKKWYQCANCGEIYQKGSTDEECAEEYKENFPNDPNREWPIEVICDDCYKEFKPCLDNLTSEEREKIEKDYKLEIDFEKDLERLTERFTEKFMEPEYGFRVTIPKEEDKGTFTEYSDIS